MNTDFCVKRILFKDRGANMLEGIMPETIRDDAEGALDVRFGAPMIKPEYWRYITSDEAPYYDFHVDIDANAYTLVYDMGISRKIDYFYVSTFRGPDTGPYAIGKFEIYAAETREDLLKPENRVAFVDNDGCVLSAEVEGENFGIVINNGACGRFVAFRQLSTNDTECISRLGIFGAYNNDYDFARRYIPTTFNNYLTCTAEKTTGTIKGDKDLLVNGIAFENTNAVQITDGTVTFAPKHKKVISKIVIIGKKVGDIALVADKDCGVLTPVCEETVRDRKKVTYNTDCAAPCDKFTLKFAGENEIDQVIVFSNNIEINVDANDVITEDFLGLGADVLPTQMFEGGMAHGFNEAYFEVEKRRIAITKPSVVRLWFQVDWFVMDHDGYVNRKYCFNSPKMRALYKVLDALKAAGTEIEFNYAWKISHDAEKWYSFPDVFNRRCSAPRDIEHFATSCSDCLRELIVNRGYDNIKYLTFYNEANGGYPGGWDFECPAGYDVKAYWRKMFVAVDEQLKKDGMRDKIKFWVAETSGQPSEYMDASIGEWLDYFNKNEGDRYEYASFHQYNASYAEGLKNAQMAKALSQHPVCLTEFAVYDNFERIANGDYDFEKNNIASALGYMNGGISAMLYWVLSDAWVEEGFLLSNTGYFWQAPVRKGKPALDATSAPFYQYSLITNYIPRHSKIIKTEVLDEFSHAVAAVTPDGGYTVAIESKAGDAAKEVKFNFGKDINKKFYKHVFTLDIAHDGNMTIPVSVAEIDVTDTLCDTVDKDYSFVVYTTIPPREQVVLDKTYVRLHPGEQVQLNAKTVDGNGKITWSMCDVHTTTGFIGTITEDGLYTANEKHYRTQEPMYGMNSVFAAKAQTDCGEYSICIIEIVQ